MHSQSRGLHRHPSAQVGRRSSELHEAAQSTSEQRALPSALPSAKPDIDRQRHAVTTISTAMTPFARGALTAPMPRGHRAAGQAPARCTYDPGENQRGPPEEHNRRSLDNTGPGFGAFCHLRLHLANAVIPARTTAMALPGVSGVAGRVSALRTAATSMDNITVSEGERQAERAPSRSGAPARPIAVPVGAVTKDRSVASPTM